MKPRFSFPGSRGDQRRPGSAILRLLLPLATAFLLASSLAAAQNEVAGQNDSAPGGELQSEAGSGAPSPSAVGSTQAELPQPIVRPRSLRPYWHVFAAFAVAWALLFAYALSLGRRFAALERDLTRFGSPGS